MKQSPIVVEQIYTVRSEKVWFALTDKDLMKEWYFTIDDFQLNDGNTFNFFEPGDDKKYHSIKNIPTYLDSPES